MVVGGCCSWVVVEAVAAARWRWRAIDVFLSSPSLTSVSIASVSLVRSVEGEGVRDGRE